MSENDFRIYNSSRSRSISCNSSSTFKNNRSKSSPPPSSSSMFNFNNVMNINANVNDNSSVIFINRGHHHSQNQSVHQQQYENLNSSSVFTPLPNQQQSSFKTPNRACKTPNNKSSQKSGPRLPGSDKKPLGWDRFHPDRSNYELAHYLLQQAGLGSDKEDSCEDLSQSNSKKKETSNYSRAITETVLGVSDLASTRVLNFAQKPKGLSERYRNPLMNVVYQGGGSNNYSNKYRVLPIPKSAERVLDAPDLIDDFYLNILAWSQSNIVAIALKNQVYLWSPFNPEIRTIQCDQHDSRMEMVTSVCWIENGIHLAIGLDTGNIQIWDTEKLKPIRTLRTDEPGQRIAALAMNVNNLVQGNRLGTIRNHDLRVKIHETSTIKKAHNLEICGIKFNSDERYLATGGNDCKLKIWSFSNMSSSSRPIKTYPDHLAAVKALSWSPSHSNILASGGGTSDKTIKLWNVSSGSLIKSIDVESQVSGLWWNNKYQEIVSTHGHDKNQLAIWKYPEMSLVDEILEHEGRILYSAISPDDTTVATAGADETLRFFKVFPPIKSSGQIKILKKEELHFQALR